MILFIWGPVDCEGGPVDLGVGAGGMGDISQVPQPTLLSSKLENLTREIWMGTLDTVGEVA